MHELGLVFEMAKVIEEALADENVEAVDTVVMRSAKFPRWFRITLNPAFRRPGSDRFCGMQSWR